MLAHQLHMVTLTITLPIQQHKAPTPPQPQHGLVLLQVIHKVVSTRDRLTPQVQALSSKMLT